MLRKFIIMMFILGLLLATSATWAQDDDTTDDVDTSDQSTVSFFVVICESQAVMNLSGTMQPGFDVYFQIFSGAGGTGNALSTLRRVNADGAFDFSEIVAFGEGNTLAAGTIGSAYISISREGAPDNSAYNDFVDDIVDGCADPLNAIGVSSPSDGSVSDDGDGGTRGPGTNSSGTSTILTPFGGVLNPNYVPPEKPLVAIGEADIFVSPRQETPGLIFAECEAYPVAEPGIVYDTDNTIVYWSWFTDTLEQMEAHLDNVNYAVTYYQVLPLPNVIQTEPQLINGNYWVFWYAQLGNLRPGEYWIDYKVTWDQQVSDGFDTFGPGTDNEVLAGGCSFDIRRNPDDVDVSYNAWPYQNLGS